MSTPRLETKALATPGPAWALRAEAAGDHGCPRAVRSSACLHQDLGAKGHSVGLCLGGCYFIWTKAARVAGEVVFEVSREEEPETTPYRQKIHRGMVSIHKREALSHRSGGMDKRDRHNTGRATPHKFKRTRTPLAGGRGAHFPYQETSP